MRDGVREALRGVERGESIPNGELLLIRKDGTRIPVYSSHTVVRRAGKPPELFCIDIDLTERRRLEKQFLRGQRMESIGTLAGGIAHDLNNVLAPIMLSIELLKDTVTTDEAQATLAMIESSAERGAELVKQVLTFARGVEGKRQAVSLTALVSDLEKIILETFPRRSASRCISAAISIRSTPIRCSCTRSCSISAATRATRSPTAAPSRSLRTTC